MFDDIPAGPGRRVGKITFEFQKLMHGTWFSIVSEPRMYTSDIRSIYKMALITAVLQDTCKNKLGAIDRMIMNNQEIAEYHNMMVEEKKNKPPGQVDIDKYQQPLPGFTTEDKDNGNT
jgi:hypothetical protein